MKIGIKYCGGCNAGYDRPALVEEIKSKYPEYDFVDGEGEEITLLVKGCLRCDYLSLENDGKHFKISSWKDFDDAIKKIEEAGRNYKRKLIK